VPEVKRWDICMETTDGYMTEAYNGDYVLYTDAVKMQREAFVDGAAFGWDQDDNGDMFDVEAEAARRYGEE
jgi:hypothetical protein